MAPFDKQITDAVRHCFDRTTRRPVSPELLPTYRQALAQYHMNPEDKFLNGDYTDAGKTRRRHIEASDFEHTGKESDRWEEQYFVGLVADAQIGYGVAPGAVEVRVNEVVRAGNRYGRRQLAQVSGLSLGEVSMVLSGLRRPRPDTIWKLLQGIRSLTELTNIS